MDSQLNGADEPQRINLQIPKPRAAILYHSGHGHTAVIANAIAEGLNNCGVDTQLIRVDRMEEADWETCRRSTLLLFGCPTYMGSVSGPFKMWMDSTSRIWLQQGWRDKIAAGFTNSGNPSGDKLATLSAIQVFASQHSMLWCPTGFGPGDLNNTAGSWTGFMSTSKQGPVLTVGTHEKTEDDNPPTSERIAATAFGKRLGDLAKRWWNSDPVHSLRRRRLFNKTHRVQHESTGQLVSASTKAK